MKNNYDIIIVGGSYAGLSAAMAFGRALLHVLIVDDGKPCNIQTPHSHNFLTNDGKTPAEISAVAKRQVKKYNTVNFWNGNVIAAVKTGIGFDVTVASGESFSATKLIFATGIKDVLPAVNGLAACWGISVLHCPYCHGYEVRREKTGIIANGDAAFDFARLLSNWTNDLTLFTNGKADLNNAQKEALQKHNIQVMEADIISLEHHNGYVQNIVFKNGDLFPVKAIYVAAPFEQHCRVPEVLGCGLTEEGYIKVDSFYETTVKNVYAIGDCVSRMRTVANAVSSGTAAGIIISKTMILETF